MYLYLERDQHRARHTPAFPLPRCLHHRPPLLLSLLGRKGQLQWWSWGEDLGGGQKIFIFEPPCLFCLRLKEGKIKLCVFCLSLWGASPGKRSGAGWPRLSSSVPDSWE